VETNVIVKDIYLKMNYCCPGKSGVEAEIIECAFFNHLLALLQKKEKTERNVTQVTSI
jgi:hypothetical protein